MSTTRELEIAQEAGSWVFRLKNESSSEARAEFSTWLQTSPQHVAEFLLATATEIELGTMETQQGVDIDALLADATPNVLPLRSATTERKTKKRWTKWAGGIAAALVLIALLPFVSRSETYRTDVGEQRTIKLVDGSVVQLNTRSRITVDFSSNARLIRLIEGEALFTVEHDATRPFEVRSGVARIQAVGTQFNVYRRSDSATVSVVEGRVKVLSDTPLVLGAGQEAAIESSGRVVKSANPEVARALAWRQRHLEFHSSTVRQVAAEFNRYNRLQIHIADEAIASRSMSGVFKADEPQSLLDFLANEGGVRFEKGEEGVTLYARAPAKTSQ